MRNRMTATSLIANATTDKPTKAALIYRYICENKTANYKQIASALHTSIATVTARLNDLLYIHQLIKVSHFADNMAHYTVRETTNPENKRPLSDAEIWQIVAVKYCLAYNNINVNTMNQVQAVEQVIRLFNEVKNSIE